MLQTETYHQRPPPSQPPPQPLPQGPSSAPHAYMHVSLPPGAAMGSAYPPYGYPHVAPEYNPPPPWGAPPLVRSQHANGTNLARMTAPDSRYPQPPYAQQYSRLPELPASSGSVPPASSQMPSMSSAAAFAPPHDRPASPAGGGKPTSARKGGSKPARPRKRKTAGEKAQVVGVGVADGGVGAGRGGGDGGKGTSAATVPPVVTESKKNQKRREVLGRIERQRQEAVTEREW